LSPNRVKNFFCPMSSWPALVHPASYAVSTRGLFPYG
jgi:hypothetical protein